MSCSLAFLTPGDVMNWFDVLCQEISNNSYADFNALLYYFEYTYIGWFRHNAPHCNLIFDTEICNMHNRTGQESLWTNDNIEGWYWSFQGHLPSCHPNLWKFVKILKKEEACIRASILLHQDGYPLPAQRRRDANCKVRILRIVDDYPNQQLIDYLCSIAYLAF